MDICGVLIRAHPDHLSDVEERLAALPGVEIHLSEGDGRIVVTTEGEETEYVGKMLLDLHGMPGVLSASLVYHHHLDAETAQLEN